jgi:hypothetical protein
MLKDARAQFLAKPWPGAPVTEAAEAAGRPAGAMLPDVVPGSADAACCYECRSSFRGVNALRMHAMRVHGYRSPLVVEVHGSHCLCCFSELHTIGRLTQHLRSKRCFQLIATNVAHAAAEPLEVLRASERCDGRAARRAVV